MKKVSSKSTKKALLTAALGAATACGASAYEVHVLGTNMPAIDFHGFASQGFLLSSDYNYLDNDTKDGSFRFTEAGLNASLNPFPRTRISAQAFTFDVGDVGRYDVVLDYAQIEYTFNDYIGVRGGRFRRPEGIYNSIQDVDVARTFILLPQGVYDSRWRDFYVSLDGGEIYGTLPMHKAGSLSYELYAGMMNPSMDGGVATLLRNSYPPYLHLDSMDSAPEAGSQLWWNTPLDGLRIGASAGYIFGFNFNTTLETIAGPFHPDNRSDIPFAQGSIEYMWKSWTFQAEYFTYFLEADTGGSTQTDSWYVSAAYRFNKWVEAGVYYNEYYNNTDDRGNSQLYQKDAALALRFDLRDWWVFKVEGHYIHGTGLLDDPAANPSQDDRGWFMLAVKTTFSF